MKNNVILTIIALGIIITLLSFSSAWSNTTFNNSLGSEYLNFSTAEQFTRYLAVPSTVTYIGSAYLNLTYPTISSAGLKVYWKFDETDTNNIKDYASGINNGTIYNASQLGKGGILGTSMQINSTNKMNVTALSSSQYQNLNFTETNMTLSFWVNGTTSDNYGGTDFEKTVASSVTMRYERNATATAVHRFQWDISDDTDFTVSAPLEYLVTGVFQHIVYVYNGKNLTLFVNGSYVNSTAYTAKLASNFANLTFRCDSSPCATGTTFDDFGIYNRSLSLAEITEIYNNGYGRALIGETNLNLSIGTAQSYLITDLSNGTSTNKTIRTSNLNSYLNSYLTTCTIISGFCNVPFIFNSSAGFVNYSSMLFSNEGFTENSQTYNTSTYETAHETFSINVTYDSSQTASASLIYNGTAYSAANTGSGNNGIFSKTLDVPNVASETNYSIYWRFLIGSNYFNSTFKNQSISNITFSMCQPAFNTMYLNLTFKNETTAQERVTAYIVSTFDYYLGDGTVNETYSYTSSGVENLNYSFCFQPNKTVSVKPTIYYQSAESPQRTWNPASAISLNNNTINHTTLKLLPSSIGSYIVFQIVNPAQQAISGATVTVSTSTLGTVESKQTDSSGSATFFLNTLTAYTITVEKTGYTTASITITPSSSTYTITLGQTASTNATNFQQGVSYLIGPTGTSLYNDTTYTFNFTTASTYWSLESYGFRLTNGSTLLGSDSGTTSTGGTTSVSINTGTNTTIVMDYFWVINGTYSNGTRIWVVYDYEGSEWSIKTLFTDLGTFLTSGMFGLTSFGLAIIVFLAIFLITGIMSYKFGFTSPAAIMALVFGLTLLFDVGMGIIPNPIGAIPHFPTFLVAVIFAGIFFKEVAS